MNKLFSIIIILFIFFNVDGQTSAVCDSIVVKPDTVAKIEGGNKVLMSFVKNEIVSTINECSPNDKSLFTSLKTMLTIDKSGKVIDIEIRNKDIPEDCKIKLRLTFLEMKGWQPAYKYGQKVCSKVYVPIACLKWQ